MVTNAELGTQTNQRLRDSARASLRVPNPLFRLHVTNGTKNRRRVVRRRAHVLHIVIQHLGHARILDEFPNRSRDALPQAHAQNILEHRDLKAATDIKGVAHGANRLPEEKLVGNVVQFFRKLHKRGEAGSQARLPALKRCGHGADIIFQIQDRAVIEEAAPLRIETDHVKVIGHVAAGFIEDAAQH